MSNKIDLSGKKAVVTGGAQGIGRAVVERFLESGAAVAIWDRDKKLSEKTAEELKDRGRVAAIAVDVTSFTDIERARDDTVKALGGIDILVNNAGIAGPTMKMWEVKPEDWAQTISVNLDSQFYCCKAIVPLMIAQKYGRIVNVASIAGKEGNPNATDLAPSMVEQCRRNLAGPGPQRVSFEIMDAARPTADGPFDLIATSMTLHWLADPAAALAALRRRLAPGGALIYATISGKSFPEWRATLEEQGLPVGLLDIPELPGVVDEERIVADADTLGFLRRMKAVGGLTPREGYAALPPGRLRRAIRAADEECGGRITWHIVYGRLAASQSSPSISPA